MNKAGNKKQLVFPQFQLQLFVLIASFTAIIGEYISVTAVNLVFWRTFMAALIMIAVAGIWKKCSVAIPPRELWKVLLNGVLIGLHWITFFWAIELSNVSICLVGMALTSFFTAFSESAVLRKLPKLRDLLLGVAVVPGLVMIIGTIEEGITGFLCACVSAALASIFPVANREFVNRGMAAFGLTFWQMLAASLTCLVVAYFGFRIPLHSNLPQGVDWIYILILAVLCTVFAFSYQIYLLNYFSGFSMNLAMNFEPVYGILLACIIFQEYNQLAPAFFIGVGVIIIVNFANALWRNNGDLEITDVTTI